MSSSESQILQRMKELGQVQLSPQDVEQMLVSARKALADDTSVDANDLSDRPSLRPVPEASYGSAKKAQRGVLLGQSWLRTWSNVMRGVLRKKSAYATAAVLIVGVVTGLVVLNKSASISLADVQAAVAEQTWVHVKFDNGREEWTNLRDGRHLLREVGGHHEGRTTFSDPSTGVYLAYWPDEGQRIVKGKFRTYPQPSSAWELIVGPLEQGARRGSVEQHEDVVNSRKVVLFERYFNDEIGRHLLIERVWADPATRLPIRVWRKLNLAERQWQNREAITGDYEFPASGPSRLEDLGVPAGLPIIEVSDKPTTTDAQVIINAGRAAMERFPKRYRAIRCPSTSDFAMIHVYWRDGYRFRLDNCANIPSDTPGYKERGFDRYHIELPATAEQILAWVRRQDGVQADLYISVGSQTGESKAYSRRNPHPCFTANVPSEPEARVMTLGPRAALRMLPNSPQWPHTQPWPYVDTAGPWKVVEQSEDVPPGYVCLRYESAGDRRDCIIDPAHDYICVNYIWWKQKDGQWIKDRQDQLLDLQRLATGQWYARRWKIVGWTLETPPKQYETVHQDDIQVLEEGDFPPDLFNGEKLLEGARVETY